MSNFYRHAKIKFKNEDKYKGCFKDGRPCGYGEMRYANSIEAFGGDVDSGDYKGTWKAGKRHGVGVLRFEDGSYFDGIWNMD
jgi:hypothetical protein